MPTINFSKNDLLDLLGGRDDFPDILPLTGIQIEAIEEDDMAVEIEANRPDMFSVEGIARYLKGFLGIEKGFVEYPVVEGDFTVYVDRTVEKVRPYIGAAHISGIRMDDRLIKSLMDLQEKLHATVGRKRKKLAIGVHDSARIGREIIYKAVRPEEISFVPLAKEEEMNLREILEKHEKGREYAHLLEGKERWPILMDSEENVLSFPPVINGQLTALNKETNEIFIDMTGTDLKVIKSALAIFCAALADRGGRIESALLRYPDMELEMPDMVGEEMDVSLDYVSTLIGVKIPENDAIELLEKARFSAEVLDRAIRVRIPPYRVDVLHPVDIAEEIAIAHGYRNLAPELPKSVTFGRRLEEHRLKEAFKESLIGLGFNEIVTLTLTNNGDQFEKMGIREGEAVRIRNPITEFHTSVRRWLLPSIMSTLSKNRHRDLPQRIFELGAVVYDDGKNRTHLAGAVMDDRASFTLIKSVVERIMEDTGNKLTVSEKEHPSFIDGRCASIIVEDREAGFFGEVSPRILANFELEHPVSAFEIFFDAIGPRNHFLG